MSPPTKEQLDKRRAERKAQIIQAALEVFVQKGYYAANVSDVATKASVSQGTIYHYFPSKDDLFLAAYETWEIQSLYSEIHRALETSKSPGEQLRALAQAVGTRMAQSVAMLPANVEFWSHISRNEAVQKSFQHLFAEMRRALAQIIQEGIARGEFTATDPDNTASLLIAFYDGLVLQWLADPQSVNWQTVSETLTDLIFYGLLKSPQNISERKIE